MMSRAVTEHARATGVRWRHATTEDLSQTVSQPAMEALAAFGVDGQARSVTAIVGTPIHGGESKMFVSFQHAHQHFGGKYDTVNRGIARAIKSGSDWHGMLCRKA